MKINMRMPYITAKDLKNHSKSGAEKMWSVLEEIKEALEIKKRAPNDYPNSIFISPEDCGMSLTKLNGILEEFQEQKILKILKNKNTKLNKLRGPISIKIDEKRFDAEYENFKTIMIPIPPEEPSLDTQNRTLQCKDIVHRFQKERKNSNTYRLFEHLWEFRQRKHISGKILRKGEAFPKYALPGNLDMISSAVNDALKSIRRLLLEKKFPIKLKVANGVQLIVTTRKKK